MIQHPFAVPEFEGPSKVVPLSEAVRRLVKPGMALHFGLSHSRAHAVAFEIVRQYYGRNPAFTLIGAGILEYGIAMVGAGLVKKMIAGFFGDTFPGPAPNKLIQEAYKNGTIEFECWTNYTVSVGLLAGALNIDFIPTKSLLGSSLMKENPESMSVVESPFNHAQFGAVRALNPDLTILHGLAADACGNTIFSPPHGEDCWGAFASKGGVLMTVEKIVSTEVIRKYSNFVKVPGHIVQSVSTVPYGAHPQGMSDHGLQELFRAYAEDYGFREEFRKAAKSQRLFDQWLDEWVLHLDHDGFLKKLGQERLNALHEKAEPRYWEVQLQRLLTDREKESKPFEYKASEAMTIAASRLILKQVQEKNYRVVLAGIGFSHLASWLSKYLSKTIHFELLTETGFYGYLPRPCDPFIFNLANAPTCKMQSGFVQILGTMVTNEHAPCLGVLSAAEIDKHGNINSTKKTGEPLFLVGSGGSNDVASSAAMVIFLIRQSKERMLEKVSFITCPGDKVKFVITDKGMFRKNDAGELVLTACLASRENKTLQERVDEIKRNCGWELKVDPDVYEVPAPASEEVELLRLFDPSGWFLS